MNDQFHWGSFLWGVVLTLAGAGLTGIGLGWWDLSAIDVRYVGPAFLILVGLVTLIGALARDVRRHSSPR